MPKTALIDTLSALLGPGGVLTGADTEAYVQDWRGLYRGQAAAVLRPASTESLARAVQLCAQLRVPIVPQGGNTSLVGGATPDASGAAILISLARLNRIRALDPVDLTLTLEAGVTLKAAQDAAADAGCLLPLSIASEGSASIGGILATNAGGNNTLRYGNARDLALGLELVLPDGQIWSGLRRLRKDNTGYCLRQLFIGSEGTLGIITAAVLKLVPKPVQREVALIAAPSAEAVLALLAALQRADAASLVAFEYMSAESMCLVLRHIPGVTLPLSNAAAHYALIELAAANQQAPLRALLETQLAAALEAGLIEDATLALSDAQRLALWRLREEHTEAQKRAGANIKNDVSVPVSAVPAFLAQATEAVRALIPTIRVAPFGHAGDGNIHFNLVQPPDMPAAAFLAQTDALMQAVNDVVRGFDGSFSAEHGIGRLKPGQMQTWRGGPELDLMRRIKHAIDPHGLMNPGVLLPAPAET